MPQAEQVQRMTGPTGRAAAALVRFEWLVRADLVDGTPRLRNPLTPPPQVGSEPKATRRRQCNVRSLG
jgi:hypothetical protein